jgi:hypothetical protein
MGGRKSTQAMMTFIPPEEDDFHPAPASAWAYHRHIQPGLVAQGLLQCLAAQPLHPITNPALSSFVSFPSEMSERITLWVDRK